MLQGIAASDGIGLGKVLLLQEHSLIFDEDRPVDPETEKVRFSMAVREFCVPEENRDTDAVESTDIPEAQLEGETEIPEAQPKGETEIPHVQEKKILVAYFSATNTTKGVAENLADGIGADLYEIVPETPYTDADLNYHDNSSRTTIEMNDSDARPVISGSVENMEQYDVIFLGFPIWLAYHNLIQCTQG